MASVSVRAANRRPDAERELARLADQERRAAALRDAEQVRRLKGVVLFLSLSQSLSDRSLDAAQKKLAAEAAAAHEAAEQVFVARWLCLDADA